MHLLRLAPLLLVGACGTAAHAASSPWVQNPQSKVRLVSALDTVPGGFGTLLVGVHMVLEPHWHVYWRNSGDTGYAPTFDLARSRGVTAHETLWPAPRRFALAGGLQAYGYAEEVVYPVRLTVTDTPGGIDVAALVDYLVCAETCVPYHYTLQLSLPTTAEKAMPRRDGTSAALLDKAMAQVPLPLASLPGVAVTPSLDREPDGTLQLVLSLTTPEPQDAHQVELFFATHGTYDVLPGPCSGNGVTTPLLLTATLTPKVLGRPRPQAVDLDITITGLRHGGAVRPVTALLAIPVVTDAGRPVAQP